MPTHHPKPADRAHWTDYWAQGRVTSLPDDFAANYDGEIAAFWRARFEEVPAGGAVLDVCTGNGAVALLAAGYFAQAGREVTVTAVDAAAVDPGALAARHPGLAALAGTVTFLGETPLEHLALPSATFDLVTSQYGFEYCDWEPAAAQVARVLNPGGRLALISHAATSDIVRRMEAEAADYERLAGLGVLPGIRRYLAGTLSHARLRKLLASARGELLAAYRISRSPLHGFVLQTLESVLATDEAGLRARRLELAAFARQIELGAARLADMLRVNRALHDDPEWYRVFEEHGLSLVDVREILYQGRHRAGLACRFDKPA